ncbi:hypothetical protein [Aquitalea sp. USM4]|uniref:hypothetical protein n=1 Tax=Aquitalea sp. USM4 TaxID=1590041 RepID=UPI00103D0F41|nr:hypothetical protein [Aquitalea sp. USM4]QBJ80502.1 hypothetical protein DKK66_19835 [Aquitalea sp. USM4]
MDRQIVYAGAIPLETDLLNTNKNVMIALAKLSSVVLGTSTVVNGFAVTPTSPASLQVNVAPGEIYSMASIDASAYSSLAADTTHQIMKQGIVLDSQALTLNAPSTNGYSVNYLIQATYQDQDTNAVALPYYNSTNPSIPWSGPGNNGQAQYTARKGAVVVSAKAGVAAATGSQATPAPDSGNVGLYVVTVAYGQTQIVAGNISQYAAAPFINMPTMAQIQSQAGTAFAAGGTAPTYTLTPSPAITAYTANQRFNVTFAAAGTTGSNTINVNGLGAIPLKQYAADGSLVSGIVTAGMNSDVQIVGADSYALLLNPLPVSPLSTPGMFSINAGTVSGNALTVGYPAQTIAFRSSTLTSGTPSVISAAAGSLTIPSGATLGTVSGQQSTVVLLALNNGGAVEPAVVNLSGGVDLSETGLISTTAISSSATAANVVYSANARSNVPYKVMGAYYITEATAGTWASAPTQAVGAGGEAFSQMMSIGYSQTWQNVTASRALGTTYYNTTSRPIFVYVSVSGSVTGATFVVNGVALPIWIPNTSSANQGSFIVPPGASYVVPAAGSVGIGSWFELR